MRILASAFFAALLAWPVGSALAAPQILGVMATQTPVPLICADGTCTADLTTFCLQRHRHVPKTGAPYVASRADALSIVGRDASGARVEVPAGDLVGLKTVRGFTAVEVAVADGALARLGLRGAAIRVGARASLVPVAVAHDPNPLSAAEIASVTGAGRDLAENIIDHARATADALVVVNRLINATPPTGRMHAAERDGLWRKVMGGDPREAADAGQRLAADQLGYCQYRTKTGRYFSLRRCLEQRHDGMALGINTTYWNAAKVGS